jgi:hypothetical protein
MSLKETFDNYMTIDTIIATYTILFLLFLHKFTVTYHLYDSCSPKNEKLELGLL